MLFPTISSVAVAFRVSPLCILRSNRLPCLAAWWLFCDFSNEGGNGLYYADNPLPDMLATHTLTQELIYSTLYAALALTDSILQIWLTLTFAVIVATYVAGKRFDRPVYLLVSSLYAFAS